MNIGSLGRSLWRNLGMEFRDESRKESGMDIMQETQVGALGRFPGCDGGGDHERELGTARVGHFSSHHFSSHHIITYIPTYRTSQP